MFVSSPGDVADERATIDRVVEEVNRSLGARLGIFFRVERWEQWRPTMNFSDYVRDHLTEADLFTMIFYRKLGQSSFTGGSGSGTLDEFEIAQGLRSSSPLNRPEIFVYFRKIADEYTLQDPGPQLRKLLSFKKDVAKRAFYHEYQSPDTFYYEFKDHLIQWMVELWQKLRMQGDDDVKRGILRRFFSVDSDRPEGPGAIIVYPPIGPADVAHLLPQITMEDFHAAHKVTKCLNIAGCHDVDAHTSDRYDERDHRTKNIVYLCLPRNHPGRTSLEAIRDKGFRLENHDDRSRRLLCWTDGSGKPLRIRSPYERYLEAQPETNGGRAMVDFAVIARYRNSDAPGLSERRAGLCDVYVSGLRGIGTWGASWYLDRCTGDPGRHLDDGPKYEALLRVEYFNNRIRKVEDVSLMPKEFFEEELSPGRIRAVIDRYRSESYGDWKEALPRALRSS